MCIFFLLKKELNSWTLKFQIIITDIELHIVTWLIKIKCGNIEKKNANYIHFVMEIFEDKNLWDAYFELDDLYGEWYYLCMYI